jgi:UMF1 family MFS transporter
MSQDVSEPTNTGKRPVSKTEIFGWAMYDFANSSYTTVIISLVYASFFTDYVIPAESTIRDSFWSLALVISTIIAIILSPLVGAICDYGACALGTMGLYFVDPGDVWLAIALIAISNAGFMLGESFCASFLTDLANKKNMGIISGLGWGLGYFGGLASLAIVLFVMISVDPPESDMMLYIQQNQHAVVMVGIFYTLSALPTFVLVHDRSQPKPGYEDASLGDLMKVGVSELKESYSLSKKYPVLFKFFIAFTVYMAGLEVIIKFVGIYARQELELSQGELTTVFLVIQVSAAVGALCFGVLESRLGAKRTVLATIAWWIVACFGIYFLRGIASGTGMTLGNTFLIVALMAGAGIGSIQSSSRTVVGLLSPPGRSAQMFGFWGMFSRVAIILGMTFGPVSDMVGRERAILLVVVFFALGGALLWRVPIDEASGKEPEAA